jgi:hypothetical protein
MACSTCTAVRQLVNVPLRRFGLPTFNTPAPAPAPRVQTSAPRPANPAWPTRKG